MKLTVERDAILGSMTRMQRIVEKKNTIPILGNVLIQARDGELHLRSTDMDMMVSENLAALIETTGATTVPAHMLYDILRKLPSGSQISFETKDATLIVKSGRSRFVMHTLPENDFPNIDVGEASSSFPMAAPDLKRLINKTRFAISTEETRYYLNGIYFHTVSETGGPYLRAVATDGHRLAQSQVAAPKGSERMQGVIVPRKVVLEVLKLVESMEGEVVVDMSSQKIRFTCDKVVLTSKLIDGTFPDYGRVVPVNNDKILKIDRREFVAAVDRVSTVSTERGRAIKVAAHDNKIVLTVTNPDSGNATDELDAEYGADAIEIGFNSKYLMDIGEQIEGDSVIMKLSDPGAPALIHTEGDDHTLFVLMPMRV